MSADELDLLDQLDLPIDPLSALHEGRYVDGMVTVLGRTGTLPRVTAKVVSTSHFELWRQDWRLVVRHRLDDDRIDDSLATLINDELFRPGWVSGSPIFERIFTGIVLTSRADPLDAWVLFYSNSIRRADEHVEDLSSTRPGDSVEDFALIHRHADALVPAAASVLELGTCFGFLALQLARVHTRRVIASDITVGTVRLLAAVAARLNVPLRTMVADAARIPRADRSVDVVLMIHLLEHLDVRRGRQALDEALRVASHRVVVAVPFEDEPTAAYGHVRTVSRSDLEFWGRHAAGWNWSVHEHLGGWLVLDRIIAG